MQASEKFYLSMRVWGPVVPGSTQSLPSGSGAASFKPGTAAVSGAFGRRDDLLAAACCPVGAAAFKFGARRVCAGTIIEGIGAGRGSCWCELIEDSAG